MTILLDTHTFIWATTAPEQLSASAGRLLVDGRNRLLLSTASICEIALKHSFQKKDFVFSQQDLVTGIEDLGCGILPMDARHALALFRLPTLHRDPFDRILLAQAWTDNLLLLTADRLLSEYSEIQTLW